MSNSRRRHAALDIFGAGDTHFAVLDGPRGARAFRKTVFSGARPAEHALADSRRACVRQISRGKIEIANRGPAAVEWTHDSGAKARIPPGVKVTATVRRGARAVVQVERA